MSKRHTNAVQIQEGGACNALALTHALLESIREARAEGSQESADVACRLIAHQIAFLLGTLAFDARQDEYETAMRDCRALAGNG